jgi:hypothetical protein
MPIFIHDIIIKMMFLEGDREGPFSAISDRQRTQKHYFESYTADGHTLNF